MIDVLLLGFVLQLNEHGPPEIGLLLAVPFEAVEKRCL